MWELRDNVAHYDAAYVAVPAPPGSLYIQTDPTSAAVMFLKTIGTDDQGWTQLATL